MLRDAQHIWISLNLVSVTMHAFEMKTAVKTTKNIVVRSHEKMNVFYRVEPVPQLCTELNCLPLYKISLEDGKFFLRMIQVSYKHFPRHSRKLLKNHRSLYFDFETVSVGILCHIIYKIKVVYRAMTRVPQLKVTY